MEEDERAADRIWAGPVSLGRFVGKQLDRVRGKDIKVSIFGYDIELDYFPGTPGDGWTAPTDEDFEIVEIVDQDTLAPLSAREVRELSRKKATEILNAVHGCLEAA